MNDLLPAEGLDTDDWRARMSEENEKRVGAMTEEEREHERREIEERYGKNIGDVLRRVRMARESLEKQKKAAASLEGDLTPSRPDGGSGIAVPFISPGSFRTSQNAICAELTP